MKNRCKNMVITNKGQFVEASRFAGSLPEKFIFKIECDGKMHCYDVRHLYDWIEADNKKICGKALTNDQISSIYNMASAIGYPTKCEYYKNILSEEKTTTREKSFPIPVNLYGINCNNSHICYDREQLEDALVNGQRDQIDCPLSDKEIEYLYEDGYKRNFKEKCSQLQNIFPNRTDRDPRTIEELSPREVYHLKCNNNMTYCYDLDDLNTWITRIKKYPTPCPKEDIPNYIINDIRKRNKEVTKPRTFGFSQFSDIEEK